MNRSLLINPTAFEAGLQSAFLARSKTSEAQLAAFELFAALGFPNRRVEGWKWSDYNAVLRRFEAPESAPEAAVIEPSDFAALNPLEFRIVNGRIELPEEDMSDGLRYEAVDAVTTIPELEKHAIATLNTAMSKKALEMEVKEGASFDRPVLIRHINSGAGFSFAQTILRVSKNARITVIETYEGEGAGLYSHLFHLAVGDGAEFTRIAVQDTGEQSVTHAVCAAKMETGARFNQTGLSTGARLSRHETYVHYWGADASSRINSIGLVSGERHADFTSTVLHKAEACETRQLHKGVAADRGRTVFQGKFHVERAAQKTDAKMTANALLLSDMAEANHKPELEIYADDVECAHGSTAGALDEDALFYLRQRGIPEREARALLIEAFAAEALEGVEDGIRDILVARIEKWLEAA